MLIFFQSKKHFRHQKDTKLKSKQPMSLRQTIDVRVLINYNILYAGSLRFLYRISKLPGLVAISRAIFQACFAAMSKACFGLQPNKSTPFRKKWGHLRHCRQDTSCRRIPLMRSMSDSSVHSVSLGCFSHSKSNSITRCTYSNGFPGKSRCLSYKVFNMLRHNLRPPFAKSMSSAS